jgi:hypothetical protein
MRTTQTVEIVKCDLCTDGLKAEWQCAKCHKDVCEQHCHVYHVTAKRPESFTGQFAFGTTLSTTPKLFGIILCDDCGKNELPAALLRFGFVACGEVAAHS